MSQDPELLKLLVCPQCHGRLRLISGSGPEGLACEHCLLLYAIEDGLPNMLIDEAKRWPLSDGEPS